MNATNLTHDEVHDSVDVTRKTAVGGLAAEAFGGIAAVVLTIIGLAGDMPAEMAAISAILIGASLLFEGGVFATSHRRQLVESGQNRVAGAEIGGTLTIEFLAGVSGIVLGILALFGVAASTLVAVAVVIFGSAFLLSASAAWQSGVIRSVGEPSREMEISSASFSAGGHLLIGLAAIVLGILAFLSLNSLVLSLVALLALGVYTLLSGMSTGSKMMTRHD